MIFLLLPKLKYSNKKIIFTQKNNFQMKKLLSKLFSYLPIMNSVMLSSYRNLKSDLMRGGDLGYLYLFGMCYSILLFIVIVMLSVEVLQKFL